MVKSRSVTQKYQILNNLLQRNIPKSKGFCKTPIITFIIIILFSSITFGAIFYGDAIGQWGSPLAPPDNTRLIDDRSIDFIFNVTAGGIHNTSTLTDYAVGNWWFEQNTTNMADPTVNNGTLIGNPTNTSGIVGFAYAFDGVGDGVNVSDADFRFNTGDFSVAFWGKRTTTGEVQFMLDKRDGNMDGWAFLKKADNTVTASLDIVEVTSTNIMPNNEWIHIVAVYDRSDVITLYFNGVSEATSASISGNNMDTTKSFVIGKSSYFSGANEFTGSIDEVLIFNRTLTSGEISEIYNQSLSGEPRTVNNCSLLLDIDDAGYSINTTYNDTVFHNTSGISDYAVLNLWFEQNSSDVSGNGYDGIIVNGVANTTGIVGYAYEFDGTGDYLDVPEINSSLDLRNSTISFWFLANTLDNYENVFSDASTGEDNSWRPERGNGFDGCAGSKFRIQGGDQAGNNQNLCTTTSFDIGIWYHMVMTRKTKTSTTDNVSVFVNGLLEDTQILTTSFINFTGLRLGYGHGGTGIRYWDGKIDEFMIFNRTLSSGEISQIYNDTRGTTYRKLNFEGYNTTIDVDFDYAQHDIDWKVQCYDDLDIPWNSSEMYLELDALVTSSQPNIGAHAFVDRNYVVGSWRFEDDISGAGGVFDETGKNNGTVGGNVKQCPDGGDSSKWNCSGRIGKGVLLDGDGDYITIADDNSLKFNDVSFSYGLWFKTNDASSDQRIMTKFGSGNSDIYQIRITSGLVQFYIADDNNDNTGFVAATGVTIVADRWYNIMVTADQVGEVATIYVDGVSKNTGSLSTIEDVSPPGTLIIGAISETALFFNGTIDEVTIWNRSLSSEEISQLYYSSAVSYNSTFTIQDISASNNNTGDLDNDTIKFIYDWYVNNESMAVLNMPFEAVNNGSEMNFSKDYSDNENHGSTSFNSNVFEPGSGWNRTGGYDGFGAYEFDGAGDYIDTGGLPDYYFNNSGATISAWVYPKKDCPGTGNAACGIITGGLNCAPYDSINMLYSSSQKLYCRSTFYSEYWGVLLGDYSTALSVPINQWSLVTCTYDYDSVGNTSTIVGYVNGVQNADLDVTLAGEIIPAVLNGQEYLIGASHYNCYPASAPLYPFNGTMDEVLIYDRALSAEQIKALYLNQTQTIKSQETVKGQSWKAEVTANDGYGDSIAYNTSELFIDDVTLEVHSIYPKNLTVIHDDNIVNFTFNVSDGSSVAGVSNCSLFLGYGGAHANTVNSTDNIIEVEVNQTFNITFTTNITHEVRWLVGCYDKDNEQTNSTEGVITFQRNELVTQSAPNIGAHAFVDRNYVVGSWRFEQFGSGAGEVFDETGINNGTIVGGVKWCPDGGDSAKWNCSGRVGKGVLFDGDDDKIRIGNTVIHDNSTISMWIYDKTGGENYEALFDCDYLACVLARKQTNGLVIFVRSGSGSILDGDYFTGFHDVWVFFTLVLDGGTVNLYRNGIYQDTGSYTGDPTNNYLDIGYGNTKWWNGTIDEVNIWNRSLSSEEVAQLYYSSAETYNSTFTIQDISASNNNTQDSDNDTIKFIYDWYVNNKSMAVLNMPFEAVNNGSEMNFSKDYSDNENHATTTVFNSDVYQPGSGWNRTGGYDGFGAYEFDGDGDLIKTGLTTDVDKIQTFSFWANSDSYATTVTFIGTSATNGIQIRNSGTKLQLLDGDSGGGGFITSTNPLISGVWQYITLVYDGVGDDAEFFVNGNSEGNGAFTPAQFTDTTLWIGGSVNGQYITGTIDELLIFNRSLSAEQIKALYLNQTQTIKSQETVKGQSWKAEVTANDGYGDSIEYNTSELFIDDVTLVVKNVFPANNYNAPGLNINFTFNISDGDSIAGLFNCSLWTYDTTNNWVLNSTKHYPNVEVNQTFNITFDGSESPVNWTIACIDKEYEQTNSSNFEMNLDTTPPITNLQFPTNNTNSSSAYINFTYNSTDAILGVDSCNLWLYKSGAWELNSTDTSITQTVNQTFNITVEDQNLLWKVQCNDTLNNVANSTTYNLTVDTTAPTIILDEPLDGASLVGTTQTLKYTPTDTNLKNCTLKTWSSIKETTVNSYQPVSGTQITKSFTSYFDYATWYYEANCSDYSGNSFTTSKFTFTTSESTDMSEGGTSPGAGGGSVVCESEKYFNKSLGMCLLIEEVNIVDIVIEEVKTIREDIKEIITETKKNIKENKGGIFQISLIGLNLLLVYFHFIKLKVRWKLRDS